MSLDPKTLQVQRKPFHVPSLEELAKVLGTGLKDNFGEVTCESIDSFDFTKPPFNLAAEGLTGNARLVEVGSPGYLLPLVNRSKLYDLQDLAKLAEIENALVIGAGAGPHPFIGVNCEGVINLKINSNGVNQQTRTYKVNTDDNNSPLEIILPESETRLALLGNLFMSNGNPGKVLKVHVKGRTGSKDFITSIRTTLQNHFKDKIVGLGGTFLVKEGRVHQHIMPDFSKTPVNSDEDLNKWLKFYDMDAPLVAVGTLATGEYDLDLRVQHFHSFGAKGEGGHYHYDVTPENVEYLGYFVPAESIYRIDRPPFQQTYGRD